MLFLINAGKPQVTAYMSDDESPEARAAFDDFWKSQDVLHDSDQWGIICMTIMKGIRELLNQ